ncbi:MAG TPA: glycosyltransferase [Candidatus Norongarragalinales archaeon]|nr:glycosyltransferase [Candidatus Norongarragalinales archaeon]
MIKVALVVGTYTGGGIGVVVDSLVREAAPLGVEYTVVTKRALARTKYAKTIVHPAHSLSLLDALKKFDIIHVMGGSILVIPSLLSGKPTVFTFQGQSPPHLHGGLVKNSKAYAIEALYAATIRKFDVITSASKFGMDDLTRRYGVKKSVWIPNGVDRKIFHPLPAKDPGVRAIRKKFPRKLLLGVGNLYPVKGWMETLKWFESYIEAGSKASLAIAGEGVLRKPMLEKIRRGKLRGRVALLGEISLESLNKYYNACDAYVSGSPYEGFCLPAIEALACGKPICVRRRGAMIEHALDSGCGAVFDDSAKSFANATNAVLAMKPSVVRRKAAKYLGPFTWENAALEYVKIYRKLIKG